MSPSDGEHGEQAWWEVRQGLSVCSTLLSQRGMGEEGFSDSPSHLGFDGGVGVDVET